MVEPISGREISSELRSVYRKDFDKGVRLFQESLKEYHKTPMDQQEKRLKFKEVMDKALTIMNESARGCFSKKDQKEEVHLEKDYQTYLQDESTENLAKLERDITHLKDL